MKLFDFLTRNFSYNSDFLDVFCCVKKNLVKKCCDFLLNFSVNWTHFKHDFLIAFSVMTKFSSNSKITVPFNFLLFIFLVLLSIESIIDLVTISSRLQFKLFPKQWSNNWKLLNVNTTKIIHRNLK